MTTPVATSPTRLSIGSVGLAIFSMFFGAGNIVFPIAVGAAAGAHYPYGILGLLGTAVIVPLLGLITIVLYRGDYEAFFLRIGRLPGLLIALLILSLLGPLGALPRCIMVSFATLETVGLSQLTTIGPLAFSLLSCLLIFLFTTRLHRLLSLLGYLLTPILLIALAFILIRGIAAMPPIPTPHISPITTLFQGMEAGYYTMDLLASFFFSSTVMLCLSKQAGLTTPHLIKTTLYGGLIAAFLLALVYFGFTYVAAGYSAALTPLAQPERFGFLATHILGPYASVVTAITMCAACLTTEIALAAAFATFVHKVLSKGRLSYQKALLATLLLTCLTSTFRFEALAAFLSPLLQVCYPALIVLCICNFLHKTVGWKPVLLPFYGTLALSLARLLW